jgi:hypothetical protein
MQVLAEKKLEKKIKELPKDYFLKFFSKIKGSPHI